jgi:hypothetical protein
MGTSPKDVACQPLADDTVDPVHSPHRLDPSGEDTEERAVVPRVRCVLTGCQADVCGGARESLLLGAAEHREDLDRGDPLGRHHVGTSRRRATRRS